MLVSVIAVVGLISSGTWAATSEPKIGVVDVQKVYKDAPRVKQYQEQLDGFKQGLAGKLDIRAQNMMLNEDEIKELVDLKTKDKATDADKTRITQLTDAERAKDEELKKLQETKDLNDQQKARLKELQDLQQKSKDTGNALIKDYDGQYQTKMGELQGKIDAEIQGAVTKMAEAKGLSLVLDKASVMLGGTDVTDDVISRLDRKMQ
jgi:Skp family chaperone for outer membrane proteins